MFTETALFHKPSFLGWWAGFNRLFHWSLVQRWCQGIPYEKQVCTDYADYLASFWSLDFLRVVRVQSLDYQMNARCAANQKYGFSVQGTYPEFAVCQTLWIHLYSDMNQRNVAGFQMTLEVCFQGKDLSSFSCMATDTTLGRRNNRVYVLRDVVRPSLPILRMHNWWSIHGQVSRMAAY